MFELPKLPYVYNDLEPYIDAKTMELHYTKHHQTYVTKLNEALANFPELAGKSLDELLTGIDSLPEGVKTAVRNHGGGHANHSLFWNIMAKAGTASAEPAGALAESINQTFGGFAKFKEDFSKQALGIFGSGWTWLVVSGGSKLTTVTTPNQDSPLMKDLRPIMGLDVWEHAYYLHYQNRRVEYIEAWWQVVNWSAVQSNFDKSTS